MSVETPSPQLENNDNNYGIKELIAGAKNFLGDDTVNNILDGIKNIPFLGEHIAKIWEDSIDDREQLAGEVEGNSDGIQGSYDKFKDFFEKYTEKYDIPDGMLAKLVNKEGSKYNTGAKAPGSSAFGLGQHTKGTWGDVRSTILQRDGYDIGEHGTTAPDSQLYATAEYLSQMAGIGGWEEAMAYYNTGPGIKNISQSKSLEFAKINPAISNQIPGVEVKDGEILKGEELINPDSYFRGAVAYYNDTPYKTTNLS